MKNKIIHVTSELLSINVGGIGTVCDELYNNKTDNEEFILVVEEKGNDINSFPNDIKIYTFREFLMMDKLVCDKVIFHNFKLANSYINKYGVLNNVYCVIHSNVIFERQFAMSSLTNDDEKAFINTIRNSKIIVISNYEYELLNTSLSLIGENNINMNDVNIIHNGITVNDNDIICKKENKGFLGYIGRLDERKGIYELCNQFQSINDKKLLIAGGGYNKYNNKQVEILKNIVNLNDNIIPLGYCSNNRKKSFFNSIDALIIPSLYEPFGMTVLEAIKNRKPIIANNTGGIAEILGENYPLFFDINKKGDMEKTINKFYDMNDQQIEFIINILYDRLLYFFTTDNMINKYRNLK